MTLVIMAAGMGSRFKGEKKALSQVGTNGECLMDYSIYDAIQVGFQKIIFVIRRDMQQEFHQMIGNRISKRITVEYVYQELEDIPISCPLKTRKKPWGTVQAILCCKEKIDGPFCVMNADDFYGKDALKQIYQYLKNPHDISEFCMVSYILKNTLSEHGSVNRGICQIDEDGYLIDIHEMKEIQKIDHMIEANYKKKKQILDENSNVSMNLWGFTKEIFPILEEEFINFLQSNPDEQMECMIPDVIGCAIKKGILKIKVLKTDSKWFGMTYIEDKKIVQEKIRKLLELGYYKDLKIKS